MKNLAIAFIVLGLLPCSVYADFGIGLPSVIKKRVENFDKKVKEKANQPPVISNLIADPTTLLTDGTSIITCTASDPNGDPLAYSWSKTGGVISDSGAQVTWTAPATEATYTITCIVADGKGGTDTKSVGVTCSLSPSINFWLFIDGEGSNQIDLFTTTSQYVDGFNLYRKTPTTSWQLLNTSLIPSDPDSGLEMGNFSDTNGITLGTTYIYQAKAVKNGQEILTSNEARVTFQGYYDPPDLTGGTPAEGATGVGVTPTFAWNGVTGAARYWIVVFDDEDLGWI
ncbi:MAG: hypothetical protein V2A53_09650, partial [bacterium]